MSRIVIALFSFLFLAPQGLRATLQLVNASISKVAPSTTSCTAPPATATFSATDTAVYVYFDVSGVNAGDTFTVAFYGPSGQLYTGSGGTSTFAQATSAGEWCYSAAPLLIAGNPAATMPGTWTVAIFYNQNYSAAFATGTFAITSSGSTGGPAVAASSDPGSVTTSPFYYTNLASLTSSPMLPNFYVSDIFGGTFTTGTNESGHAIFADTVPSTGYYSVQFQTTTPVQLTGYTLYLADDGSLHPASRSATHFTFLAGTSPGALSVISQRDLATLGSSYYQMLGVAPTNGLSTIKVTDTFAAAATYQYFELRFTPNNGTYPGVRVMELVGNAQSGTSTCTYSLDKTSAPAGSGGGPGSFQVSATPSTCAWTATSNAPSWLTTSSSGTGNGTVNYTVAANTSASSRNGTITVGGQTSAGAQTFTVTQAGTSGGSTSTGNFAFNGFANTAGLTLVGNAATASTSDGTVLRLTPANKNQSGAAYSTTPVTLGNNATFSTQFQFRFSNAGGTKPADGITFVLGTSTNGLGASGVGLGYAGVSGNSVAIEFDTYDNTNPLLGYDDGSSSNHVAIDKNGNLAITANTDVYGKKICDFSTANPNTAAGCMSNGDLWTVNINYDGAKLTVTLKDDPKEGSSFTAINGYAINLASLLGQNTAYVGFTGGTGNGYENQDIVTWTFANTAQSGGTGTGYDPAANFATSPPANPSGVWSYGYETKLGSGFTIYPYHDSSGIAGVTAWEYAQGPFGQSVSVLPAVGKNTTSSTITNGSVQVPNNVLWLHPGPSGQYSIVRFTAPAAGTYTISGSFSGLDNVGPTTTDVHILQNGSTSLFSNNVSAFGAGPAFSVTPTLNAGDTIDFAVGYGADGNYLNDSTGLNASINQGAAAACTYTLSASSYSFPTADAGNNSFNVTAASGCTWTAISNAPTWLTTSSTGNGSGPVNYSVTANTSTSSRNGTITVGGQTSVGAQTFNVTQAGAVACSYSISPSSYNMAAQGGSSSVSIALTAGTGCSWTASVSPSASSWLHLGSTTSGTGSSGSVTYTADANTSTVSRTGIITIANQTFTLTQAGGASATAPSINQGGIVNAVSNRGGGGIAQGSMFTIYGTNLGPAAYWQAYQFPIPDTVNGVTVTVAQGSTTLKAYLLYVQANQINAIMPSNAPLGNVQVTVNYNGIIGASAAVTIVKVAFGINSAAYGSGPGIIKNYDGSNNPPLNTASTPAKPGQVEIVVGTGLGPITTPDNQSPPAGAPTTPVQVLVGGIPADVAYSGRAPGNAGQDQINFTVPANAPLACSIPVQISAGGIWSNPVLMAISSDGKHCQDTSNPYSGLASTGGKSGTLGLIRVKFSGQTDPTKSPTTATLDLGFGAFAQIKAGGDTAYSPVTNLPPPGTCSSSNKASFDLGAVMGNGGSSLDPTVAAGLDAGAQLTVTGGAGGATGLIKQTATADNPTSPYMGLLGGILNISGATVPPPFLDGGPFTISGPGGKDVGKFSITVPLAPAITWTNPPSTINRASPLTLTWTGGDSTQTVLILAGSTDQTSKASGGFLCVAPAGAHSFTVPVNSLADLIPTGGAATSSSGPIGMLSLMPMHLGNSQMFTPLPAGLDVGVVFDTTMIVQTVQVQ